MLSCSQRRDSHDWPSALYLLAVLLLALPLINCGNSCTEFVSNPGGTVGLGNLAPCNGQIPQVTFFASVQLSQQCQSCSQSNQIRSILLNLQGIELHRAANASDEIPDWQDLYPQLKLQPRQFELQRGANGGAMAVPLGDAAAISAGSYDRVRLSFAPGQEASDDRAMDEAQCRAAGLNCAVMGDGRVVRLPLNASSVEFSINGDAASGGGILVPAQSDNHLQIELTVVWSLQASAGQPANLLPLLTGSARIFPTD